MNLLRRLRGDKKQVDMAKEFNITQTHYGYIEGGLRTPSLSLARQIAEYYGMTIEEIFFVQ